jgi:tRNA(fMet)-specific endonuclease VapC
LTHLDTSFVVDLLREATRGARGPAHAALDRLGDEVLAVSVHVACELYAGAELSDQSDQERAKISTLLAGLEIVAATESFPKKYGEVLATLRRRGESIGTMDLLIAVAALEHGAALLTRNARDFERVPGLIVMDY